MRASTYLVFDGNCAEAFDFYKSVFGLAAFDHKQSYSATNERIMHVSLPISSNMNLMGSDTNGDDKALTVGNHVYVCLVTETKAQTDTLFAALQTKTITPLADMPWGSYHGSCVDKYGIQWMFDCSIDKEEDVKVVVSSLKREVEGLEQLLSHKKAKTG